MSDSDSENLSDLEQEEAVSIEEDIKELSGELNDIEESDVKWSDLVSRFFHVFLFF